MMTGTVERPLGKRASAARRRRLEILRLRSDGQDEGERGVGKVRRKDAGEEVDGYAAEISVSLALGVGDLEGVFEKNVAVSGLRILEQYVGYIACRGHGSVSVCGRRREMEDAVTVAPSFVTGAGAEERYDFFGVYDGHGGSQVALKCRDRLHRIVAGEIEGRGGMDWKEVMEAGFEKMDGEIGDNESKEEEVVKARDSSMKTVGSTAVVAVVGRVKVVVANCGDSRAVMARGGKVIQLSSDHKPDRPDELERVESAGGRVINWNGYRVLGVLATSRSIGDHYLKPYVISQPEVTITERTDADEFLVLASDGLWDVISNEVACEVVRRCLAGTLLSKSVGLAANGGPAEAAALLVEFAMSRGSRDNISVVVVDLRVW